MKTTIYLGLALISLCVLSCKKAVFGDQVILVTGTEVHPIVKFTVENTPAEYSVTATTTHKAAEDINVEFEFDPDAVEEYNRVHNTTYFTVPEDAIEITGLSTVIKAGSGASTPVSVKVISTSPLVDGRSYLIPLTIRNVSGGGSAVLESSRTIFLRIARIINFPSVSMNNATGPTTGSPGTRGRFNGAFLFDPQNPARLPNFTLEIKNLVYAFRGGDGNTNPQPIQTLVFWTNQWEQTTIGLRYGELGNPNNSLQLIGALGSAFAYGFNANQWYTISLSYDGSKCIMYVDGVKAAEVSGSMVMEFSRMQFGQVWGGYDTRQYFNGRIAECRVWSRALTAGEIKLNLCGADPNADGLLAYWKMNEGSGHIFHNSSKEGSKYDMDWSKVYWDPNDRGNDNLTLADKSSFVVWADDILNKCSQ
ncbi:MAG TPA: DUF1735 domain-containing protein [Chitinophagaceae bacterium]|nr:DUF1735 domain-containing protein [Chitinophagaceae bacterium]